MNVKIYQSIGFLQLRCVWVAPNDDAHPMIYYISTLMFEDLGFSPASNTRPHFLYAAKPGANLHFQMHAYAHHSTVEATLT
jgi:hypothetical protein